MKIVFATNNAHKLEEIRDILGGKFEIMSLADIGCHDDIPETGDTLEYNAIEKAAYVFNKYHIDCFADDTGLEVDALGGAPGVHTARYAGAGHDTNANVNKLLHEMEGKEDRKARFRTVICLITTNDAPKHLRNLPYVKTVSRLLFRGEVEGTITTERHGTDGFGYDPIFKPEGYDGTFAELGTDVKNKISHRAKAVEQLAEYLKKMDK